MRNGPIFDFTVCLTINVNQHGICENVKFDAFRRLKRMSVPFLKTNTLKDFTALDALIHHIQLSLEPDADSSDPIQSFIERQVEILNLPKNGKIYNHEDLCLAFTWFAQSRSLYQQLRQLLRLPSVSILSRITALAKHTKDIALYKGFVNAQDPRSRGCILLVDEIYVKASIIYSG